MLTSDDHTAIVMIAGDRHAGPAQLRAQLVLAVTAGVDAREVALTHGVDLRSVQRAVQGVQQSGLDGLDDRPRGQESADLVTTAITTALSGPPDGTAWTTRSVATAVGTSAMTVSRAWRTAGFRAGTTSDQLVTDPWFRGCPRALAGVYVSGARVGSHRAIVFVAEGLPGPPRARRSEDETLAATGLANSAWDAATLFVRTIDGAAAIAAESAESVCCNGTFLAFLSDVHARMPPGSGLYLALDHRPGVAVRSWARTHAASVWYTTPDAWRALVSRSVAATTLLLEMRSQTSNLAAINATLRASELTRSSSASWLAEADSLRAHLKSLRAPAPTALPRRNRPPRRNPAEALVGLRERRSASDVDSELPPLEFLTQLQRDPERARLRGEDCVDAMVVQSDLEDTTDLAELALLTYLKEPWVDAPAREIASVLGVHTVQGVADRSRGLQPGRQRRRRRDRPIAVTGSAPGPDAVRDIVTELHQRWYDDLVDHDDQRERLPGDNDLFANLAYIVDPHRPVLRSLDPTVPGPQDRRRADGFAGLRLIAHLRQRLPRMRLGWYRLAESCNVPLSALGAPFGRSGRAAWIDKQRLMRDERVDDTAPGLGLRTGLTGELGEAVDQAVATLFRVREAFADDEDFLFWLTLLDEPGSTGEDRRPGLLINIAYDMVEWADCDRCDEPLPPVVHRVDGTGDCMRCQSCRCDSCGGSGVDCAACARRRDLVGTFADLNNLRLRLETVRRG